MSTYISIGRLGKKVVYVTPYCKKRLEERTMSYDDVIWLLKNQPVRYPGNTPNRSKLRGKRGSKNYFLTIEEYSKYIVVITGGDADAE